jgi:hypothetical protein
MLDLHNNFFKYLSYSKPTVSIPYCKLEQERLPNDLTRTEREGDVVCTSKSFAVQS